MIIILAQVVLHVSALVFFFLCLNSWSKKTIEQTSHTVISLLVLIAKGQRTTDNNYFLKV